MFADVFPSPPPEGRQCVIEREREREGECSETEASLPASL